MFRLPDQANAGRTRGERRCPVWRLQIINNNSNQPFIKVREDDAQRLFDTLGVATRQRMQRLGDNQRKKAIKYDGLVADGVLSQQELADCIKKAREQA